MKIRRLPRFPSKADFFIVLIIIVGFLLAGVFVKKVVQKDQYVTVEMLAAGGEWWWGTPPPYYWMYPAVTRGATEYDVLKRPVAEVLDIVYQGLDNRKVAWMKVRLKVKRNLLTKTYTFKQTQVQVGKTITIAPNNVSMIGNIVSMEGQKPLWNAKDWVITGKLLRKHQWEADALLVGDVMRDNDGKPVAEVLEKTVEQAQTVTVDWLGNTLLRRDPLFVDVTVKMKIRVQIDGDIAYFNFYQPVQPGQEVEIQLPSITIRPNIVTVEKTQ